MIRIGIVGMGIRGTLFARALASSAHARVSAVADVNPEALEAGRALCGCPGYPGIRDMLDREEMHGLIIALPDFLHVEPFMRAVEKGLHVMVEKPFATTVEDAESMRAEVKRRGVKCLVAFENRWNPPFIDVKRSIDNGELGDIQAIHVRLHDSIVVPTEMIPWLKDSSPAWFLQSHMIDMAGWLSGKKAVKVYAVGSAKVLKRRGLDTLDTIQTTVSYADGTSAVFCSSWILPESHPSLFDLGFEIIGDGGAAHLNFMAPVTAKSLNRYQVAQTLLSDVHGTMVGAPCSMVHGFVDCIRLDTEPLATEDDGLENTRILAAVHRSIVRNEAVAID